MISRVVEMCLRDYPETRDSDRKLLVKVWEHCGFYLSEAQRYKFFGIASPESIRRTRQKIQESGKYPASERVSKSRRLKSLIVQQNIHTIKPEKTDNVLELDVKPIRKTQWG